MNRHDDVYIDDNFETTLWKLISHLSESWKPLYTLHMYCGKVYWCIWLYIFFSSRKLVIYKVIHHINE